MIRAFLCLLLPGIPMACAEPVLKNSGFGEKELTPWECDEGRLVREEDNPVLEVALDEGTFGLFQKVRWPGERKKLTLSFRVKASEASEELPVQLRARLYDKSGNSEVIATKVLKQSGRWITVRAEIDRPDFTPVSFLLESNRGEGMLWLDDVTLE